MANQIGNLNVTLSANIEQFKASFAQAQKEMTSFSSSIKSSLGNVRSELNSFVAAWAGVQGVKTVLSQLSAAGDLQDLANGLTVSAEKLQELQAAGLGAGVSIESFQGLLQRVAKASSEVAEGNDELKAAFDKLGISAVDLENPDKVLLQIVDHLGQIPSAADRMAVAVSIAGKGGAQALMRMATDGVDSVTASMEEARQAGLIMTNAQIKGADDVSDAIGKLAWEYQQKLKIAVVDNKDVILELAQATASFLTVATNGVGILADKFVWLGKTIGETAARLAGFESGEDALAKRKTHLDNMLKLEQEYQAKITEAEGNGAFGKGTKLIFEPMLKSAQAEIAKTRKEISDLATFEPVTKPYETQYNDLLPKDRTSSTVATTKASPKTGKKELTEEEKFQKEIASLLESSDAGRIARLQKQTAELEKQKVLLEMQDTSKMTTDEQDKRLQKLAEYNDALTETADAQKKIYDEQYKAAREATEQQQKYNDEQRAAADAILDTLNPLRAQQRELDKVSVLIDQGFLPEETLERLREFQNKTKESTDWTKELGMTMQSAFQSAIVNGNGVRDVMAGMLKDIAAIIIKLEVMNPLMEAIFGKDKNGNISSSGNGLFSGLMSSVSGAFSSLFNATASGTGAGVAAVGSLFGAQVASANGNVFQGHINAFANGGVLTGPTLFPMATGTGLAGEAGYEGILPLKRNASGQLGVIAQGGGSNTVVNQISITVQGGENAKETGQTIGAEVVKALADQRIAAATRPGGLLNKMSIT